MKRLFIAALCAGLPWMVMLLNDNPGAAIVALVLQVTLIGWPVATVWAWRVQYPPKENTKKVKAKPKPKKEENEEKE